ncbi:MAG: glycosyltransferase family 87 protein [Anaerolineae bacterium]
MPHLMVTKRPHPVQRQHVLARLLYSHSSAARWMRRIATGLGIVLGVAQLKLAIESLFPAWIARKDFLQEYILAKAMVDRVDPYLPIAELASRYLGSLPQQVFPHPTPHPPPVGLLLAPLALFDYPTAAAIWLGVELLCLVAAVYLVSCALDARFSVLATFVIGAFLLLWHPFWQELLWGQLQVPMLVVLAGSWLALRKGHSLLGGAFTGLALLLKPVPWPVLLLFVMWKDWHALAGAVLVILVGYVAAGLLVGLDTLLRYFTTVLPWVTQFYREYLGNISLSSIGWRLFAGSAVEGLIAPPVIHCTAAASIVAVLLPCLVLLVACAALWKRCSLEASLGIMICVSILISPISWRHYLVLVFIPAAQVVHWLVRHQWPARETNWALIVAGLLFVDWGMLVTVISGRIPIVEGEIKIPLGLALVTLMPAVAVGALACLVASLSRDKGYCDEGFFANRSETSSS